MKNKIQNKKIDTAYVFSENNQVYFKRKDDIKAVNKHSINSEEWFPVNFQWKS